MARVFFPCASAPALESERLALLQRNVALARELAALRAVRDAPAALRGWDAYQGRADYVFNSPGLLSKERQWVALVAERGGYQMRFTWKFEDGSVQVTHFGRTRVDDEIGVMIAPSEDTKVAQTWYEGEEP